MEAKNQILVDSSIQIMPEFPYLTDEQIRDLDCIDFELALQLVGASSVEAIILKLKRKSLKKSNWKQDHDRLERMECSKLETVVSRLAQEKSDLSRLKDCIVEEISHYKVLLEQMHASDTSF